MKNLAKIPFIMAIWLANLSLSYSQTARDKITFLSDYYMFFLDRVEENGKYSDSIYYETIMHPIYQEHFKSSEYANVVKQFYTRPIKDTLGLKNAIEKITINQEAIKSNVASALKKSREYIENDSLIIYITPVSLEKKQIIKQMGGVMGLTAGSKQIILTIDTDVLGWENVLQYVVAHEYNHAYWTEKNFLKLTKWTLLDHLVFEGKADYFAHLIYPKVAIPWTMALTGKQKEDLMNRVKSNFQNENISLHMEIMFGSKNYPIWGGYSLGYDIVSLALANNSNLKVSEWTNLRADTILKLMKMK